MTITNAEMTSATHADFLPTVWADDTRDAIEFAEVLPKLVTTQYEDELSIGRVLRIPQRMNFSVQTKSEGFSSTVNFQAQDREGDGGQYQDITVDTFQYAAALLNAVVAAQSKYDERQRIAHGLGYALMRGVEVSISALFGSFSQIVGTLGADVDDAVIRRARQYLSDSGIYADASWVFSPAAESALFGISKYTSSDFVDKPVIESATLPSLYNYPAYVSNLLTVPATGQTNCGLIHKEALSLLRQIKPTFVEQFLIRNLADGVVAYQLYSTDELEWISEGAMVDSADNPSDAGAVGDFGAVLIRSS